MSFDLYLQAFGGFLVRYYPVGDFSLARYDKPFQIYVLTE